MSNALAIASVTAVLKDLLDNAMIDHSVSSIVTSAVTVTTLPPDRIATGESEIPQLNLFLYHVKPNSGWCNIGLPSHNQRGDRLTNPPLALDLYYLLSVYGKEDFDCEILLGYAMQRLHEIPVLTRKGIRKTLSPESPVNGGILPNGMKALTASELADQVEQIKITPQVLNTEELSKLWTAFQAKYRPSIVYHASVVLIESHYPTRNPIPVRECNIITKLFRYPIIEELSPQIIMPGASLLIRGRNLKGTSVKLLFGKFPLVPDSDKITGQKIIASLPEGLYAGVNTVQVIHELDFGTQTEPHQGFESNLAAFVLRPIIIDITNVSNASITARVNPLIGKNQKVILLLNERSHTAPASYTFSALHRPSDTNSITIPISGVKAAEYFMRLKIDGAESLLDLDPASENFGPMVTIP